MYLGRYLTVSLTRQITTSTYLFESSPIQHVIIINESERSPLSLGPLTPKWVYLSSRLHSPSDYDRFQGFNFFLDLTKIFQQFFSWGPDTNLTLMLVGGGSTNKLLIWLRKINKDTSSRTARTGTFSPACIRLMCGWLKVSTLRLNCLPVSNLSAYNAQCTGMTRYHRYT